MERLQQELKELQKQHRASVVEIDRLTALEKNGLALVEAAKKKHEEAQAKSTKLDGERANMQRNLEELVHLLEAALEENEVLKKQSEVAISSLPIVFNCFSSYPARHSDGCAWR